MRSKKDCDIGVLSVRWMLKSPRIIYGGSSESMDSKSSENSSINLLLQGLEPGRYIVRTFRDGSFRETHKYSKVENLPIFRADGESKLSHIKPTPPPRLPSRQE